MLKLQSFSMNSLDVYYHGCVLVVKIELQYYQSRILSSIWKSLFSSWKIYIFSYVIPASSKTVAVPRKKLIFSTSLVLFQFLALYYAILQVDEHLRAEEVEIYFDPAELFGGLFKGPLLSPSEPHKGATSSEVTAADSSTGGPTAVSRACPFFQREW